MSVLRNKRDETRKSNASQHNAKMAYVERDMQETVGQAGCAVDLGYGLSPIERQLLNEGSADEILSEYNWRMSNHRQHDSFTNQCHEYLYKVVEKDKQ